MGRVKISDFDEPPPDTTSLRITAVQRLVCIRGSFIANEEDKLHRKALRVCTGRVTA